MEAGAMPGRFIPPSPLPPPCSPRKSAASALPHRIEAPWHRRRGPSLPLPSVPLLRSTRSVGSHTPPKKSVGSRTMGSIRSLASSTWRCRTAAKSNKKRAVRRERMPVETRVSPAVLEKGRTAFASCSTKPCH